MSKYFWNTIIFFIFVSLVFLIIIFIKQNNEQQKSDNLEKTPITSKYVEILTDEMKQNLEKNAPQILENLKITKENINSIINENIDKLFDEIIDKNLDGYLDFHYSVKGEYTEFGAILFEDFFGNINELINEKVLGKDFNEKLNAMSNTIVNDTDKQIFEHINFTTNIATHNVDLELNKSSLSQLTQNIRNNIEHNLVDIKATVIGTAIATKLAISIATKISAKVTAKVSAKIATKAAASGIAATSGVAACGPAAIICGVGAAVVAWFGTDAIVVSGDEYFNRDDFKQEIINSLNEAKEELKLNYKPILERVDTISINYQNELKNTSTKKRMIDNIK